MQVHRGWLAASLVAAGACYVETPKHDVADADAIREAAAARDAGDADEAGVEEDARVAARDAGADADAGEEDACACEGDTPLCIAGGGCGECDERTPCGEGAYCDPTTNSCVACIEDAHCTSADAPVCNGGVCEACTNSTQCARNTSLAGLGVCSAESSCVECTPEDDDACVTSTGAEASCHPTDLTCTGNAKGGTIACGECESDDECQQNHVCVAGIAAANGTTGVCLPVLVPGTPCARPYAGDSGTVTSANGVSTRVCTLRSDLTCAAHNDFVRGEDCGLAGTARNDFCGVAGENDGICVYLAALDGFRCTYACEPDSSSSLVDCPQSAARCARPTYPNAPTQTVCVK